MYGWILNTTCIIYENDEFAATRLVNEDMQSPKRGVAGIQTIGTKTSETPRREWRNLAHWNKWFWSEGAREVSQRGARDETARRKRLKTPDSFAVRK